MANEAERWFLGAGKDAPRSMDKVVAVGEFARCIVDAGTRPIHVFCDPLDLTDEIASAAACSNALVGFEPIDPTKERPLHRPPERLSLYGYTAERYTSIALQQMKDSSDVVFGCNNDPELIAPLLERAWSAVGLMLNGRQTFCYLPEASLLHPELDNLPARVIHPQRIRAQLWFIQSCHSPFVWRDFGADYATLPLSILKSGARAVIASTRVQWPLPELVEEFLLMAASGAKAAELAVHLNGLASSSGADNAPFILFGDPTAALSTTMANTPSRARAYAVRLEALEDARRVVSNLAFTTQRLQPPSTGQDWNVLIDTVLACTNELHSCARRLRERPSVPQSSKTLAESINLVCPSLSLPKLTSRIKAEWKKHAGYYYSLSSLVEACAIPIQTGMSASVCPNCKSTLQQRVLELATTCAGAAQRTQFLCPRCLVVQDSPISKPPDSCALLSVQRECDKMTVVLKWTNTSLRPRWCFALAWATDPNNMSANASPTAHHALAKHIASTEAVSVGGVEREAGGFELAPGSSAVWRFSVSMKNMLSVSPLFYLLYEVHLFIDFAWHWYASTFRAPALRAWLETPTYAASLLEVTGGADR